MSSVPSSLTVALKTQHDNMTQHDNSPTVLTNSTLRSDLNVYSLPLKCDHKRQSAVAAGRTLKAGDNKSEQDENLTSARLPADFPPCCCCCCT